MPDRRCCPMRVRTGCSGTWPQAALCTRSHRLAQPKHRETRRHRDPWRGRLRAALAQEGEPDAWAAKQETLQRMLAFMGPAMAIPLGDPFMSVVDTVCIGQVRQLPPYMQHAEQQQQQQQQLESAGILLAPPFLLSPMQKGSWVAEAAALIISLYPAVCWYIGASSPWPCLHHFCVHTVRLPVTTDFSCQVSPAVTL